MPSSPPNEKESVIVSLSDHWSVLILPSLFFILALLFLGLMIAASFSIKTGNEFFGAIVLFASLTGIVFAIHFFFLYVVAWLLSDLVITTSRIINLDILPYVRNDSIIIDLHQINEIKKSRHGFMQNIFNYGSLALLIFGGTKEIKLTNVRCPSKVASFLEAYNNGLFKGVSCEEMRARYASDEKFM